MSARNAQIARLYVQGVDPVDLRERFSLSKNGINNVLRSQGVHQRAASCFDWTEERVKFVREQWMLGVSAGEISKLLGVTRNAVIGLVYRRGMKRPLPLQEAARRSGGRMKGQTYAKAAPKPKLVPVPSQDGVRVFLVPEEEAAAMPARQPEPTVSLPSGYEDPVLSLRALDCRYPIGEPGKPGFRFCYAIKAGNGPYCISHKRLCQVPAPSASNLDRLASRVA